MNHECSIRCIYCACSMLRMFYIVHVLCKFYAHTYHVCLMHETCGNTCILCAVYIEMFSLDTVLCISLVSLHSRIKHMSFLHVSTWQAHCTVAFRENKISCSKFLWAFVKYYCDAVLYCDTVQNSRAGKIVQWCH